MRTTQKKHLLAMGVCLWVLAGSSAGQLVRAERAQPGIPFPKPSEIAVDTAARDERIVSLDRHALIALPLATALGALLALRPRRRGTPHRSPPVIQTQIILSIIGALVMLVVGSSLARAFGVVGAAGLVRYRAKIEDPKDAGVMLSSLTVGLACGVGLYALAIFAAVFIGAMLWVIESFEPTARKFYTLEVKAKEAAKVQPRVEALLRRRRVKFELREASPDEFSYEVQLPMEMKTDDLSAEIIKLDPDKGTAVNWSPEKKKVA